MKKFILPALGLAAALALSPMAGVASADAAPMHHKHKVVHHVVHHKHHPVHHTHHVVHHKHVVHRKHKKH